MDIEVVHDHVNRLGRAVPAGQEAECAGEVTRRAPLRDAHVVAAASGLRHHEDIGGATPMVLGIAYQNTVSSSTCWPHVGTQLHQFLIETNDGLTLIIRKLVARHDVQ